MRAIQSAVSGYKVRFIYKVIHRCHLYQLLLTYPLCYFSLHHLLPMKSPATPDTYIYIPLTAIHDPAAHSTCSWLAEHGCSRSCTSSPIRRLCRSNYVSVVHKPVATCYPNSLDSHFPWHDPLPLLLFKNKAGRAHDNNSSVRVQL